MKGIAIFWRLLGVSTFMTMTFNLTHFPEKNFSKEVVALGAV